MHFSLKECSFVGTGFVCGLLAGDSKLYADTCFPLIVVLSQSVQGGGT